MGHLCIACKQIVTSRQEALLCDGCNKWQHRKCNTGISREVYRNAVQCGDDIPWQCERCATFVELPNFALINFFLYPRSRNSDFSLPTLVTAGPTPSYER